MARFIHLEKKLKSVFSIETLKKPLSWNVNIIILLAYFILELSSAVLRSIFNFIDVSVLSIQGQDFWQPFVGGVWYIMIATFCWMILKEIKHKTTTARLWALGYITLSLIIILWDLSRNTQDLMNMIDMINEAKQKVLGQSPPAFNLWQYIKNYLDMLYLNLSNLYQLTLISINLYLICYLQTSKAENHFKNIA